MIGLRPPFVPYGGEESPLIKSDEILTPPRRGQNYESQSCPAPERFIVFPQSKQVGWDLSSTQVEGMTRREDSSLG